jgi:hypothetical protein
MKKTETALPSVPNRLREFPDINIADITEVLERRSITRPDSKLDKMLKQIDQAAVKKAAEKAGSDFSAQIDAAYQEVSRQLDKKNLI